MPRRDLRRHAGRRQPRQSILIVCLGERPEHHYLRALRRDFNLVSAEVTIVSTSRDPHAVVALAEKRQRQDGFDEVWCIFDHEFPPENATFRSAVQLAMRRGIRLAVSNPAFEVWVLLHFGYTTRVFTDNDELLHTVQTVYPQYTKNRECYDELKGRQPAAIENARRLRAFHPVDEAFPHPSTDMHLLVERFISQKNFQG
jgi:hypothetical protein